MREELHLIKIIRKRNLNFLNFQAFGICKGKQILQFNRYVDLQSTSTS